MSQIVRKNTYKWFRRVGTNFSILDELGLDELRLTCRLNRFNERDTIKTDVMEQHKCSIGMLTDYGNAFFVFLCQF